jgi:large subunit ribosomal protein L25
MELMKLNAAGRTGTGKGPNRRLRAQGLVPGILYGKGSEQVQVAVKPLDVVNVLESRLGRNSMLVIDVDGGGSFNAVIRDYQLDPVRRTLLHIDFLLVEESHPLVLDIPVNLVGMGDFEKLGGRRRMTGRTIKISCLPAHIPESIAIDVSHIEKPEVIYASSVDLGENVNPAYRYDFPVVVFDTARIAVLPEDLEEGEGGEEGEEGADGEGDAGAGKASASEGRE